MQVEIDVEALKSIASIISAIIIPVVLLVVGNNYSRATKERELQGKFVELAVEILREPPEKQSKSLRDWATQVITSYSGVPLSMEARRDLIESTQLPGSTASYSDTQLMLQSLGYYSGPIDGVLGPALREAISKFQKDSGTFADGIAGQKTLAMIKERYEASISGKRAP